MHHKDPEEVDGWYLIGMDGVAFATTTWRRFGQKVSARFAVDGFGRGGRHNGAFMMGVGRPEPQ